MLAALIICKLTIDYKAEISTNYINKDQDRHGFVFWKGEFLLLYKLYPQTYAARFFCFVTMWINILTNREVRDVYCIDIMS